MSVSLSELLKDRTEQMSLCDNGVIFGYTPHNDFVCISAPNDTMLAATASELKLFFDPTRIVLLLENGSQANVGISSFICDHLHGCTYKISNEATAKVLELARQDSEWIRQGQSKESAQQLAYLLEATAADRYPSANWLEVAEALKQIAPLSLKPRAFSI